MKRFCYSCMEAFSGEEPFCPHCGAPVHAETPVHQLRPGTVLDNRYLVGRSIGQGGFGITYIGRDKVLDMRVAIKEYYPNGYSTRNHRVSDNVTITDDDRDGFFRSGKEKFLREAKILAKFCDDPGIVGVRDFFEANGTAYIVMEYLNGVTLKEYITERGPLPARGVFDLMHPIITVLGKVHEHGVIHRDISPDNILLLPDGRPKLLDFGAAREVREGQSLSVMLKLGYAPEEQYRRKGNQGPWTDVYALCATMYFCLTGRAPEESIERVWNNDENMVKPSEAGSDIQPRQEAVILKGLAVKGEDRYQSMAELEAALYPDPESLTLTEFTLGETRAAARQGGRHAAPERPAPKEREAERPRRVEEKRAGRAEQKTTPAASKARRERPEEERPAARAPRRRREKRSVPFSLLLIIFASLMMLFFGGMLIKDALAMRNTAPRPTSSSTASQDETVANVVFVSGGAEAATPTITSLRLLYNGQEVTAAQGLAMYVGSSATLTAQAYSNTPGASRQFTWSSSDSASLRLTPSDDTVTCECTALQAVPGGMTLTLSCYGQVLSIPIYIS